MLPDSSADQVLARLQHEARRRRVLDRIQYGIAGGWFVAIPAWYVVRSLLSGHWGGFPWVLMGQVNSINFAWSVLFGRFRRRLAEKSAVAMAAQLEDNRCVAPLIDVYEHSGAYESDTTPHELAAQALAQVLGRLQPSDAPLLDEAHRAALRRILEAYRPKAGSSPTSSNLAAAALHAVTQIGDINAMAQVEGLAGSRVRDAVSEAAGEALLQLRQLEEEHRATGSLLRPADAPGDAVQVLLRPAQGAADTDTQALLRPAGTTQEAPEP